MRVFYKHKSENTGKSENQMGSFRVGGEIIWEESLL